MSKKNIATLLHSRSALRWEQGFIMGSNKTIPAQTATNNARVSGTQKHLMSQPSVTVGNQEYDPDSIIAIYQDENAAFAAVTAAELTLKEARASAEAATQKRAAFDKPFKLTIEGTYAGAPTILGDFGIVQKAKKVTPAAVKAAAAVKAQATKGLRHPKPAPVATAPLSPEVTPATPVTTPKS
jgi:hypothetical protein